MTLNVSHKGLILAGVPLLFQFAFLLLVLQFQSELDDAERLATHTKEVIAQGHEIQSLVVDAQGSVRGYMLTGNPRYTGPYGRARDTLPDRLAELEALVADNPGQTAKAGEVRAAAEASVAWLGETAGLVWDGEWDAAVGRVASGEGEGLMTAFRRQTDEFLAEEERLDRVRATALDRSRGRMNLLLVAGGIVAVATTLWVGFAFRRGITRRFAALDETARRLATGAPLPPPLAGDDEIARLDRSFRAMAAAVTAASARVRDLYDHAPCGYHSVAPDGTLVEVNRTELQWLGYEPDEVVGRMRFADLVSPASRPAYLAAFERVREQGAVNGVELEVVRKDGTTFPVLASSSSVRGADGRYVRSRTTLTDLTERKQAEKALRASEERFRLLVESVQDYAILMLDPAGRVTSWNAGAGRMKGYTADEIVGRHFSSFYPPEAVASGWPENELEAARATGRFEDEGWRVRKDGSRYWANVVISPVTDADGRLLGYSKISRDLTERKRAEEAERLFADVTRNIPLGLLIYQLDGDVLRVRSGNSTASQLVGFPLDPVVGRAVTDVFPAIPPDQLRRYAAVAATGRPDELGEFRYGDAQVAERWWAVQAFPLPDRSVGVSFQDVSARRNAEDEVRRLNAELEGQVAARTAELHREKELFRSAFDHSNVGMVITDLGNRFIRTNAAFARLFGYTPTDVLGLGLADVTHPDHMTDSLDRRQELLAGAGDSFHMEKRYRTKDGRVLWGLTNVSLVRGPDGKPLMYVGQVQDITDRKRAEDDLRHSVAELEAANRELAHKNAENEMFVYSVSHDLRSPLVNLQGFSKELEKACRGLAALLAEDGVPAGVRDRGRAVLDGKVAKSVGFIQSAVLRLSGIIDALLRLSRAGRVEYRWGTVDVGGVVEQVVAAAQGTVADRGATVRIGALPPAWGDRTAVEQAFANLIGNALTYLDPARPGEVEVGALPDDDPDARTYFVKDNGLGIADGHRSKIFQAFQRAHPGVGSGEGLGLAIVARVAERHRGRVWVESTPGEGSTFYITLPAPPTGGSTNGRP